MSIEGKEYYRNVFLKSDEWKTVRSDALAKCGANCCICGEKSIHNDAHHVSYPGNIWETKPTDLRILCRFCHDFVHSLMQIGQDSRSNDKWRFNDTVDAVQTWIGKVNGIGLAKAHPMIKSGHRKRACRLCNKVNPDTKLRNVLEYYGLPAKPPVLWNFCDSCFDRLMKGVKWPMIPKERCQHTPAKIFTAIKRFIRFAS